MELNVYRVHSIPILDTILSQMNPLHSWLPYSFNIHFNLIVTFTPKPYNPSLSTRFHLTEAV